ncbi:hypothetical protein QBC33DRAFT_563938 [Phialemonium atrogriseum]|uniref:CCHC-type domain-containing protein n=1 Tax=Phialemonium atrogriseum TaxID=1093897 RepID=A0AAJ0BPS6_9PEZI|nr:uncharacterized protein QBC33DRAFT_563938 [Phialemonium atrogriseum]KAK1762230.1 hypothetical protein QBC33DRAFT_563938 [Phialemonium atrogriseum]
MSKLADLDPAEGVATSLVRLDYRCFRCNEKGDHLLKDCPTNLDPSYDTVPPRSYICTVCNATGAHWNLFCPENKGYNSIAQRRKRALRVAEERLKSERGPSNHGKGSNLSYDHSLDRFNDYSGRQLLRPGFPQNRVKPSIPLRDVDRAWGFLGGRGLWKRSEASDNEGRLSYRDVESDSEGVSDEEKASGHLSFRKVGEAETLKETSRDNKETDHPEATAVVEKLSEEEGHEEEALDHLRGRLKVSKIQVYDEGEAEAQAWAFLELLREELVDAASATHQQQNPGSLMEMGADALHGYPQFVWPAPVYQDTRSDHETRSSDDGQGEREPSPPIKLGKTAKSIEKPGLSAAVLHLFRNMENVPYRKPKRPTALQMWEEDERKKRKSG